MPNWEHGGTPKILDYGFVGLAAEGSDYTLRRARALDLVYRSEIRVTGCYL